MILFSHEALYEKVPLGFFAFSDSGTILALNETAAAVLKYTPAQLRGKDIEKIFTLPTRIFYQTHFFPLVKMQGHAEEIFINLLCADGENLPVLLNAERIELEGNPATSCAFIVVRNRKKFEDELVAARKTAEKALTENTELQKAKAELQHHASELEKQVKRVDRQNDELRQFNHVITHTLKEPLRKLLIFSSKLDGQYSKETLEKVINTVDLLNNLVVSLQQYVWLNEKVNDFKEVDLNVIVADATGRLKNELQEDVLNIQHEQLDNVWGDEEQLEIMFYHILKNAAVFRRNAQANVTVSTFILKQNKFRNVENKYQYEDFVKIEITDDGIGFENEYSMQIFELFQKLQSGGGQGLGLALCKRIAENHDGYIEAESVKDALTKITIWLPHHP